MDTNKLVNLSLGFGVLLCLVPLIFQLIMPENTPGLVFSSASAQQQKAASSTILVYVSGAVIRPGVYVMEPGARITHLLVRAGGFAQEVDLSYVHQELNLARVIKDEEHFYIPFQLGALNHSAAYNQSKTEVGGLLRLNSASKAELTTLPGIGEATAEKIISARPFNDVSELKNVSGIGEAKFAAIKDLVQL